MTKEQGDVLAMARFYGVEPREISDGFHTFNELYDHQMELWIALCKYLRWDERGIYVWRTKKHSDGSEFDGWFILGVTSLKQGPLCPGVGQMTYYLPISRWDDCEFASILEKAPEWDGHTSEDVLKRLREL